MSDKDEIIICPNCKSKQNAWELIEDETGDRLCHNGDCLEVYCGECKESFHINCTVEFDFSAEK